MEDRNGEQAAPSDSDERKGFVRSAPAPKRRVPVVRQIRWAVDVGLDPGVAVIQALLPAVTDPPVAVLLVPPDAGLRVQLVPVDDPFVGPVVVHDGVGAVEAGGGGEVFGDDSMWTRHFGAVCKRQQRRLGNPATLKSVLRHLVYSHFIFSHFV